MFQLENLKEFLAITGVVAGLTVCAVMGEFRTISVNSQIMNAKDQAVEFKVSESAGAEVLQTPQLTKEQQECVDLLWLRLKENDLEAAAMILNEKNAVFTQVFEEELKGKLYLYHQGIWSEELEGEGMVFKKATTVFFGEFSDGDPNGNGAALQAVVLDAPRYDFSTGYWKDGELEGFGKSGYHYYEGVQGDLIQEVKKEGNFTRNLMEGELVYTSTNSEGIPTTWHLTAQGGVTVLDERWKYDTGKKEYLLLSDNDISHAYVIPEQELENVRWKNMIRWQE